VHLRTKFARPSSYSRSRHVTVVGSVLLQAERLIRPVNLPVNSRMASARETTPAAVSETFVIGTLTTFRRPEIGGAPFLGSDEPVAITCGNRPYRPDLR
jgi:hypothetical protein